MAKWRGVAWRKRPHLEVQVRHNVLDFLPRHISILDSRVCLGHCQQQSRVQLPAGCQRVYFGIRLFQAAHLKQTNAPGPFICHYVCEIGRGGERQTERERERERESRIQLPAGCQPVFFGICFFQTPQLHRKYARVPLIDITMLLEFNTSFGICFLSNKDTCRQPSTTGYYYYCDE
jgi:hypothetical protein